MNEAVNRLVEVLKKHVELDIEEVGLLNAAGRVASENISATRDKPSWDLSAVDGYALNSVETIGASLYNPIEFRVVGVLRPGQRPGDVCIESGTAVRVHTGAPLPCGANAVVMDEDVEVLGNKILVYRQVAEGSNVIFRGEDLKKGEVICEKGQIVSPAVIAALTSSGIRSIRVYRKIRISIISIGDELVEPGEVGQGECNSTAYILYSQLLKDVVFEPKYYGIIPDDPIIVEESVLKEIERGVDVVITTGGTGVGESDVIESIAKKHMLVFRGVRMRPGRPTSCSIINGKPVIHLSGFPVAAWTGYELILRNAVIKWLGLKEFNRPIIKGVLTRRLPNVVGYVSVVRVSVELNGDEFLVEPYMLRGSGVISSLLRTTGYLILPEDVEGYDKGTKVTVYLHTYW